jgi:hypothetical protein
MTTTTIPASVNADMTVAIDRPEGQTSDPITAKAMLGVAVRRHGKDSFQAYSARQDLAEAVIAVAIERRLNSGPPLKDEAKRRLALQLLDV